MARGVTQASAFDPSPRHAVYGAPPSDLVEIAPGAVQLSPLRPGARAIETLAPASLEGIAIAAPPGSIERRYVLAQALRALAPGGTLQALAPKDKGGARLRAELEAFGCEVAERAKARQRICSAIRPDDASPSGSIAEAIREGAPRTDADLGLRTQPGVFSWNRVDAGSALLLRHLPALAGRGADLGAGLGILARAVLASPEVGTLVLVEIDRRAVEAARRNVPDPRASVLWADARDAALADLDFVVTNPPFHSEGVEDRGLGQAFIAAAARMLRRGGRLVLVANRHMPYEALLRERFRAVETLADEGGYKIIEARK